MFGVSTEVRALAGHVVKALVPSHSPTTGASSSRTANAAQPGADEEPEEPEDVDMLPRRKRGRVTQHMSPEQLDLRVSALLAHLCTVI